MATATRAAQSTTEEMDKNSGKQSEMTMKKENNDNQNEMVPTMETPSENDINSNIDNTTNEKENENANTTEKKENESHNNETRVVENVVFNDMSDNSQGNVNMSSTNDIENDSVQNVKRENENDKEKAMYFSFFKQKINDLTIKGLGGNGQGKCSVNVLKE